MAHSMVKFVINLNYAFICNKNSLIPFDLEAWLRDSMLGDSV